MRPAEKPSFGRHGRPARGFCMGPSYSPGNEIMVAVNGLPKVHKYFFRSFSDIFPSARSKSVKS